MGDIRLKPCRFLKMPLHSCILWDVQTGAHHAGEACHWLIGHPRHRWSSFENTDTSSEANAKANGPNANEPNAQGSNDPNDPTANPNASPGDWTPGDPVGVCRG